MHQQEQDEHGLLRTVTTIVVTISSASSTVTTSQKGIPSRRGAGRWGGVFPAGAGIGGATTTAIATAANFRTPAAFTVLVTVRTTARAVFVHVVVAAAVVAAAITEWHSRSVLFPARQPCTVAHQKEAYERTNA
jgi:hypothetical protein